MAGSYDSLVFLSADLLSLQREYIMVFYRHCSTNGSLRRVLQEKLHNFRGTTFSFLKYLATLRRGSHEPPFLLLDGLSHFYSRKVEVGPFYEYFF